MYSHTPRSALYYNVANIPNYISVFIGDMYLYYIKTRYTFSKFKDRGIQLTRPKTICSYFLDK